MSLPIPTPFVPIVRDGLRDAIDRLPRGLVPMLAKQYRRTLDMRLDINEDDGTYFVNVDMPGVRKEDIEIGIAGNRVSIGAEVNRGSTSGKGRMLCNERYRGQACRAFSLPVDVDAGNAEAIYDGGVLSLVLPKKAGASTTHLAID